MPVFHHHTLQHQLQAATAFWEHPHPFSFQKYCCRKLDHTLQTAHISKILATFEIPIENLIEWDEPNGEGCVVSDKITKEGYKVGYMLREEPTEGNPDSGWRFMAGNEDDEYMENPDNHHVFALNTICNYDSDIIPYLHAKIGSAFIRVDESHFEKYHVFKPMFIQKQ